MKKLCFVCTLLILGVSTLLSQTDEKRAVFQFSFFPPVGTQGSYSSEYTNDYSLNLLIGYSNEERKLTIGGLANIIKKDASGLQIAGISNIIGGDAAGLQIGGIVNTVGKDAAGLQIGGITNIIGKDAAGIQIGGITNIIGKDAAGMQIAGLVNTIGKDAAGILISGGVNLVRNDLAGMQITGLMNAAKDVAGFQIAGLVNKAKNVSGFQLGLVNIAEANDYPIGLINIIRNGEMSIGLTYNEIGSSILSFRSGGKIVYGILGAGYNWRAADDHQFLFQGGIGVHLFNRAIFRTNIEITASNLSSFAKNETAHYSLGIFPALKLSKNWELFAGPTFNYLQTDELENRDLFPGACINLWKEFGDNKLKQAYIGISGGIQYVF